MKIYQHTPSGYIIAACGSDAAHEIETLMDAANISRYYVTNYASAIETDRLDTRLFASIEKQKAYFAKKLSDAERELRSTLFGARATLANELRRATGDDRSAIETSIAGIDAELAG